MIITTQISGLRRRKRPLSLLEVLIVMVLASILLGTLFYSQKDIARVQNEVEVAKEQIFQRERFFLRMNQLMTAHSTLQMKNGSLILNYDNGVDRDSSFSGPVISLLYLQNDKVFLATWPQEQGSERNKARGRLEILWEKAESLSFLFFDEKKNKWEKEIPQEGVKMIKIIININKNKIEFPFFL